VQAVLIVAGLLLVLALLLRRRYGNVARRLSAGLLRRLRLQRVPWLALIFFGTLVLWLIVWVTMREDYADRLVPFFGEDFFNVENLLRGGGAEEVTGGERVLSPQGGDQ
jgi:hypothetical protein